MAPDPWFPTRVPLANPRLRLFCLPPAGGGASLYRTWPRLVPNGIEVCPVQLPGREDRMMDEPIDDMSLVTSAIASAMKPLLDKPFALFGHSMGAVIGFEILRLFQTSGANNALHFFASAGSAPHIPDPDRHHLLNDNELLAALRREDGYPDEVLDNAELMELLFPTIRADAAVTERYQYRNGPVLLCPITAIVGSRDHKIAHASVSAWRDYTSNAYNEIVIDGDHSLLKTASNEIVAAVANALACGS